MELLQIAINSGHPMALLMTVNAWIFSMVSFPGMDAE